MKKLIAIGLSAMMTMSMTSVAAMADSSAAEAPDVDLSGKKICLILPGSIDD